MSAKELEKIVHELYFEQGLSLNQTKHALTQEYGVSEIEARKAIDMLREQQDHEQEIQEKIKEEALKNEVLREDESNPPMQRAKNKIVFGFILLIAAIFLILTLPPSYFNLRFIGLVFVAGIWCVYKGFRDKRIIDKNKKAGQ